MLRSHKSKPSLFLVVLSGLLLQASVCFSQQELSGEQSGVLPSGNYIATNDIWVNGGTLWTLEPGVNISFDPSTDLTIYGTLRAIGTSSDSIYFRPTNSLEGFDGILLINNYSRSIFDYCVITGSSEYAISSNVYASVNIFNSRFSHNNIANASLSSLLLESEAIDTIRSTFFTNNFGNALHISQSHAILDSLYISYNSTGIIVDNSDCQITNSLISNNSSGGINAYGYSSCIIDSCTIAYNTNTEGAGLHTSNATYLLLSRSLFYNNNATQNGGGFYSFCGVPSTIINCVFYDNYASSLGSSIYTNRGNFYNSVIMNSNGSNAVYLYDEQLSSMINCCFFNNNTNISFDTPEPLYLHDFGILSNTNINGDSTDIYENIFLDPSFISTSIDNFYPTSISPCIDAGSSYTDLDPDSTFSDIGIHFYDQNSFVSDTSLNPPLKSIFSYPNPFNNIVNISIISAYNHRVKITIFNVRGQLIHSRKIIPHSNTSTFTWRPHDNISSGVYFLLASDNECTLSTKLVFLK
ncbi:right-handed parallel beta-helix repeat-containing protein [bacterium]|nr:right-handed parallel beta-helix repeat-containing protein [bacterium]